MGCLIAIIAMLSARAAFALVWIFGDRVQIAFTNAVVPFLGLLFLPWTALMYTFAYHPRDGVTGGDDAAPKKGDKKDQSDFLSILKRSRKDQQ